MIDLMWQFGPYALAFVAGWQGGPWLVTKFQGLSSDVVAAGEAAKAQVIADAKAAVADVVATKVAPKVPAAVAAQKAVAPAVAAASVGTSTDDTAAVVAAVLVKLQAAGIVPPAAAAPAA